VQLQLAAAAPAAIYPKGLLLLLLLLPLLAHARIRMFEAAADR